MFENYVCKIYVSNDPHFSSHLEATAFGFDNGQQQKILTAAHVVTNALGKIYPVSNTLKLYVKFLNHQGLVNEEPVLVDFILNRLMTGQTLKTAFRLLTVQKSYYQLEYNSL